MKKMWLMMILMITGLVMAQEEDYYQAENDEHANDDAATEIITSDPIIISTITDTGSGEVDDATPGMDMTASMEASFQEFSKKNKYTIMVQVA